MPLAIDLQSLLASGQPGMLPDYASAPNIQSMFPTPSANVGVAPVDRLSGMAIPTQGPSPTAAPPEIQHIGDILSQLVNTQKTQSANNGGMIENILSQRFQPNLEDASRSVFQSGQTGQYVAPQQIAAQRSGLELAPYTAGLDLQTRQAALQRAQTENQYAPLMEQLKLRALAAQAGAGKIPPGYRMTADGNLEAVPGGPADLKIIQGRDKDTGVLSSTISDLDRLSSQANDLLNHPGLSDNFGLTGMIPNRPGSSASDAQAMMNTLKSQTAFNVLQNMRNNSKTGGALGQVSDKEGQLLQNNLAALDKSQSADQFKLQLQKIIQYAEGAKQRARDAFSIRYGDNVTSPSPNTVQDVQNNSNSASRVINFSDLPQ